MEESDDGFVTESDSSSDSGRGTKQERREPDSSDEDEEEDIEEIEKSMRLYKIEDETLFDRIYALRDIINPSTRSRFCERIDSVYRSLSSTTKTLGNVAWVVTTSVILVGLPMALSIESESMLVAHEKEMERQQQGQQTLLGVPGGGPGGNNPLGADQTRTAVTPTGF